ncbi:MAG TPA: hypothetical protein P5208_12340, partial [Smithellaceae bacterium]|nr:hypothetical protein [Smithellaceae bacterium]
VSLLFHYKGLARAFGIPIAQAVPYKELTQCVRDVIDRTGKPVIAVLPNMTRGTESMDITELIALTRQEYLSRGIPVFDELHDAIRAISHINNYYGGKIK